MRMGLNKGGDERMNFGMVKRMVGPFGLLRENCMVAESLSMAKIMN